MAFSKTVLATLSIFVFFAIQAQAVKYPVLVSAKAKNTAGLTPAFNAFKDLLGGEDNGSEEGPIDGGFRSINWDADVVPFDMPFDFFNTVVPRGALFFAKNKKFAVSNDGIDDTFDSFNKQYPKIFRKFSDPRLFSPVDKNRVAVKFRIPGSNKKALVVGFGAVFTDVDLFGKTFIVFFDQFNKKIGKFLVKPKNKGLSFLGLVLNPKKGRRIKKVVIRLGTVKLGVKDIKFKKQDVVVLDDLLYGEPQ